MLCNFVSQLFLNFPHTFLLTGQILSGKGSEFQDLCEQLDETFKGKEF